MTRIFHLAALALLVLGVASGAGRAAAQSAQVQIALLSQSSAPSPDGLDVQLFFTVKGSDGQVLPRSAIDFDPAATAALVPDRGGLAPAAVGPPNSPIRIALLLDASGSIGADLMKKIRSAAEAAVRAAPDRAEIAVYRFSRVEYDGPLNAVEGFNTNRDALTAAIRGIPDPKPNDPTCLYNAAYLALAQLAEKRASPQDRSALIVFTDGVDDDGSRRPCSRRLPADVMTKARDGNTAIHTIGLCRATCSNIDSAGLRDLALNTNGAWASGGEEQLGDLFGASMERLKSQWMLSTKLLARKGDNQVLLTLKIRDGAPLPFTVNLPSPQDFQPPPSAQIVLKYDQPTNTYAALLTVENRGALKNLVFQVWNDAGSQQLGPIVEEQPINLDSLEQDASGRLVFKQSALKLRAQKSYCFQLREPNAAAPLASTCAKHDVQPGIAILKKPAPDENNSRLAVQTQIIGIGDQPLVAEWQMLDKSTVIESGSQTVAPRPDGSSELVLALPAAVRAERQPREYRLLLVLKLDGQPYSAEETFSVIPVSGPNYTLPIILGVALAITIAVTFFLWFIQRPRREALPPPGYERGPYNEPTDRVRPDSSRDQSPRVMVRIVSSPDANLTGQRYPIERFPCVIGRSVNRTIAQLSIGGDPKISLKHLLLSESGGVIFAEDVGSANGTFRDGQQIEPGIKVRLGSVLKLQLGETTEVELTMDH